MKPLLVAAALLALSSPVAHAGTCAPLLTDPRGDALAGPAPADDAAAIDVVSADLRTTRTALVATVRVADLPESRTVASHLWSVGFTSREQRYAVAAHDNLLEQRFDVAHLLSGGPVPEDDLGGDAFEGIGDATGRIDVSRDTVTITVPLSLFAPYGGIGGALTAVRVETRTGLGYPTGEVYELGDLGRTDRSYVIGSRC